MLAFPRILLLIRESVQLALEFPLLQLRPVM